LVLVVCACGSPTPASDTGAAAVVEQALPTANVARSTPVSQTTARPIDTAVPLATVAPTVAPTAAPTVVLAPTAPPLQAFDSELAVELQQILDETVADGFIPGAVLAVYVPGQELWEGASGIADRTTREPMTPDTRVRIASISKVFTAIVVLQLVEEGIIDINAPMTTWLPNLVPNGENITVRNLLNHTTGLYDYVEDRNFINLGYQNPTRVWEPHEMVDYAVTHPPAFAPSTPGAWDYSSTNYVILGMIVEQATGNTLAQEMRTRILEPLNMQHTFFAPDEAVEGPQARGYRNEVDQTGISMSIAFATANIVSTVADVRTFGQGIQNGTLLRPETLDILYTFEDGHGQYNMPELAYGNGIMRHRFVVGPSADGSPFSPEETTVVGHIGGFGGFRSALWTVPATGITIALGENQGATDPNILASRVLEAVLRHTRQGG
jgi:D-alanyl-D-alanine carboxypeptidase